VIVSIRGGVLSGASAGDSGAWLVHNGDAIDLTEGQSRKPLVGAGCRPWRIAPRPLGGSTLVVASDGLFRYARLAAIVRRASGEDLPTAARALVDLVRLASGGLQDDVAVVLCRKLRVPVASDDRDAADEDWMPVVAATGWVIVTRDFAVKRRPAERAAWMAASAIIVMLRGDKLSGEDMASMLLAAHAHGRLDNFIAKRAAPMCCT
jgi:hypothetical protein